MIPVTSNCQQFWLNFQHEKLAGADVRDIPRYEELEELIARTGHFAAATMEAISLAATEEEIGSILGTTLGMIVMGAHTMQARIAFGENPVSHRTLCKISRQTSPTSSVQVAGGKSETLKGDVFSRRVGRWWSLTRAMEDAQTKGIEAGDVLHAYFHRPGNDSAQEIQAYVGWYEMEYLAKYPRTFNFVRETGERYVGAAA